MSSFEQPCSQERSGEVLAGPVREVGVVKVPLQGREEADEGADVRSVHGVGGGFQGFGHGPSVAGSRLAVRVTPPHHVADDGGPVGGSSLSWGEYAARWWLPSTVIAMG